MIGDEGKGMGITDLYKNSHTGGGEGKELGEERVPTAHPITVSKEMAPRVIQEL